MSAFLPTPYAGIELHLHLDCCASYGCVKALAPDTTFEEYRATSSPRASATIWWTSSIGPSRWSR